MSHISEASQKRRPALLCSADNMCWVYFGVYPQLKLHHLQRDDWAGGKSNTSTALRIQVIFNVFGGEASITNKTMGTDSSAHTLRALKMPVTCSNYFLVLKGALLKYEEQPELWAVCVCFCCWCTIYVHTECLLCSFQPISTHHLMTHHWQVEDSTQVHQCLQWMNYILSIPQG